jgi:hypothetical protein
MSIQSLVDALEGVDHAQGQAGKFGQGPERERAALRDLADAVRAYVADYRPRYTAQDLSAAWERALDEAEALAGDDAALDILSGAPELAGGPFSRATACDLWNALAEAAKAEYNPDGGETGDSIRSDSVGDLVVNLAGHFLADPDTTAYAAIADAWKDLNVPGEAGPERDAAIVAEVCGWF